MKHIFSKLIILALVFILTAGAYYYIHTDKTKEESSAMGEARLPVITANVQGVESNLMYGYTENMEGVYMRDTLTIIPDNHNLDLNIYRYGAGILSIGFEVRTLDTSRLIEDTMVEDWKPEKDVVRTVLEINNMLKKDEEYLLIIKVGTEDFREIRYYTRIIDTQTDHYRAQAEFVRRFHEAIFDEEKEESIISYLEPKSSEDNSNFGVATIHSNFRHITWEGLEPERVTTPVLSCKELVGDIGCYRLKYMVRAKNDYEEDQYYNVTEDYRVRWTSSDMYLLDYHRTMEQEFDATTQNISGSRINTGIGSSQELGVMSSASRTYIAFVKEKSLWMMDIKKNDITEIFSYKEKQDKDIRNRNDNHAIKIVSLDDEGNMKFFVYGYMNRGEHEGSVGIALYDYNSEENLCSERLFIPFTRSYDILKESMGKLAYVNEKIMYIMINDCVYSIDLKGNEYVQIISGLKDGTYAINDEGNRIAWQENGGKGGATRIKVLDLQSGGEYVIKVGSKYRMKVLGFVNNDFVYGIASKSLISEDKNGYITFPMSKLKVVNSENELLKEHQTKGVYFTGAEISGNMINLKQIRYDDTKTEFVADKDYQIFANEESGDEQADVSTIVTDRKKTETVISFVYKVTTTSKLKVIHPKEIVFDGTNALSIRELSSDGEMYYVYAYGDVTGVYTKEGDAIVKADKDAGVVVDENGNYLWRRISRPTEYLLSGVSVKPAENEDAQLAACLRGMLAYNGVNKNVASMLSKGNSSLKIINSELENRGLDLSGCTLSQVLYYVCDDQPVLGMLGDKECVLIVGYDFYNAVLLNPQTGQTYKQGLEEAEEMFQNAGNRFLGIK